jgi:hypothetical protein
LQEALGADQHDIGEKGSEDITQGPWIRSIAHLVMDGVAGDLNNVSKLFFNSTGKNRKVSGQATTPSSEMMLLCLTHGGSRKDVVRSLRLTCGPQLNNQKRQCIFLRILKNILNVLIKNIMCSFFAVDKTWVNVNAQGLFEEATGCPVVVLNDADAAGLAEMNFGEGRGHEDEVVLVTTFGTGIGTALYVEGKLVGWFGVQGLRMLDLCLGFRE